MILDYFNEIRTVYFNDYYEDLLEIWGPKKCRNLAISGQIWLNLSGLIRY